MRILEPKVEIIEQASGYDGMLRHIELAGRTCYKSQKLMTNDSAAAFVKRMVMLKHNSVLEHGTVYLKMPLNNMWYTRFDVNPYSKVVIDHDDDTLCITTNFRVLMENEWTELINKYMVDPTPLHERRVTVRFTTQIAISREFNRHRVNSMSESSTRYCNYGKKRFGKEVSISRPDWVSIENHRYPTFDDYISNLYMNDPMDAIDWWLFANLACEKAYLSLTELGLTAQQARVVLPIDTNTELVHTAFVSDWRHFIELRSDGVTGKPHPDAEILATPLKMKLKERGLI